jgi:predicted ArsR family transcriptional regulator
VQAGPTAPKAAKPGKRARRSAEDVEQVAGQVLAYVQGNPGQRLEEIGRGLKVDTTGLKRPIQDLLATGRLRTEGQKRGTKYFAGSGKAAPAKAGPGRKKAGRKAGKRAGKRAKRK